MSEAPPALPRRKFLVVVDDTPECRVAMRFAARRAEHTNGLVTLLYVVTPADPQAFMAVERAMREEALGEAEQILHNAARDIHAIAGITPEVVIREGKKKDEVLAVINADPAISILVLAAGTGADGPGPLVALTAAAAAQSYPIPVTIVPGGLTDQQVDALA